MKILNLRLNIYALFLSLINILLTKSKFLQKSCLGTEAFSLNIYSLGTSCKDMINCCPTGTSCTKDGKCIKKKNKNKKRKLSKKRNNKDNIEPIKIEPEYVKKEEKNKPGFKGPVRINWETLTKCLDESGNNEPTVKNIIKYYKSKKESDAMKIVFEELKKNSPIIVDCLNKQEHLQK